MARSFDDLSEAQGKDHLVDVARRALAHWDLTDNSQLSLLNISENATYRVDNPSLNEPLILRVHRTGYHTINAVRTELAWMKALQKDAGVQTPQAIAATDGEMIKLIETPELNETRMVVMFRFIEGQEPDESRLLAPFSRLGKVTAKMHAHAREWQRPPYFERLVWDYQGTLGENGNWGRWQDGPGLNDDALQVLSELDDLVCSRLAKFGSGPERFGLIHADLRLANLLETDNDTRVIDFDDAGLGWFLYDIASALSFMEGREDIGELISAWVAGYREEGFLSDEEVTEIPTFLMLRRLAIIAWIGSHSDTDLARELGVSFTADSIPIAQAYIAKFSASS